MSDCRFGVSPVNYPDPDECLYFQNSKYTFSSFLDRSLARIRATGEKTTWIRGDDVLMSGKNLFLYF